MVRAVRLYSTVRENTDCAKGNLMGLLPQNSDALTASMAAAVLPLGILGGFQNFEPISQSAGN